MPLHGYVGAVNARCRRQKSALGNGQLTRHIGNAVLREDAEVPG
jgi:hypothetical protein